MQQKSHEDAQARKKKRPPKISNSKTFGIIKYSAPKSNI